MTKPHKDPSFPPKADPSNMLASNFREWDAVEELKSADDIQAYLEACVEIGGNDEDFMFKVRFDIERAMKLLEQPGKTLDPGLRRDDDFEADAN